MTKFKRIFKRIFFTFFIIIPIVSLAHFILFPQQTRSILINWSNFKNDGRLYFNSNSRQQNVDTVRSLIQLASLRVDSFWGQKTCNPKYIYCEDETEFKKFGSSYSVPALTHLKLGTYIVLSNQGIDLDIIAHELSHAEFYERIGFYNYTFKIPKWFDEGLAMQNDYRNYYSEDTLKVKSGNLRNLPNIKKLETGTQFNEGTINQVMLNYMAANYEVKKWYTKQKLDKFIKDINSGKTFKDAFE